MNSIENNPIECSSLNQLVTDLSEGDRATFDDIIRSMKVPVSTFRNYCSWSSKSYTRNCIVNTEKFELILLCWEKGQITPIHDHGGEECWVRIIEGDLKETVYEENESGKLTATKTAIAKTGDVTYMIDFMGFHSLENIANERSMSLHLYAKPIRKCNVFDKNTQKFINRDLVYSTIAG